MHIETEIKVNFTTVLGDSFDDATDEKEREPLIEQHISDFCEEHKIDRCDVRVVSIKES